jgi:pyruvate dehydrogenase E1 component alpha subunit
MAAPTDPAEVANSAELGRLADAADCHEVVTVPVAGDQGWLIEALRRMILIRAAEEWIGDMVSQGLIRCPCHLAIGQEAAAVGVARQVQPGDRVFGAHRSHAHFLALGGSVHRLMAEVQGKVTGASRGMGGSMHLLDLEHGLYGTVPIVAATIPIAVGSALAAKLDGGQAVAVSFFGDGATEEGVFHESLNLAATLKLPVLFACENNFFSSHLHISLRQPKDSVCRYAEAHCVPWQRVDGNDVIAVAQAAARAFGAMRAGQGPQFLELVTYRWRGHVGPREDEDVGVKRKDDLALWKGRDPIRRLAEALIQQGCLRAEQVEQFWADVRHEVRAAWTQASRDPFPPSEALLDTVYGPRA